MLALEYWREGCSFFHLAISWGLHASSVCCIIRRVKDVLTESKAFTLPGEKKVQPSGHQIEFVVAEVAETPTGRPRKSKEPLTEALR